LCRELSDAQEFFDNGDRDVDGDRNPDLRLNAVGGSADESFDAQMLLDPFEEQLHLPTVPIEGRHRKGRQEEIVGQENEAFLESGCFGARQKNRLIAAQARASVDRTRQAALELKPGLGSNDKEDHRLMETVQTVEIEITTIHDQVGSGIWNDPIHEKGLLLTYEVIAASKNLRKNVDLTVHNAEMIKSES
jgi:hypothetical protein